MLQWVIAWKVCRKFILIAELRSISHQYRKKLAAAKATIALVINYSQLTQK